MCFIKQLKNWYDIFFNNYPHKPHYTDMFGRFYYVVVRTDQRIVLQVIRQNHCNVWKMVGPFRTFTSEDDMLHSYLKLVPFKRSHLPE